MFDPYPSLLPLIHCENNAVTVVTSIVKENTSLLLIGDYHCTKDDERDLIYSENSKRVKKYGYPDYNLLREWLAKAEKYDAVLLLGDMFSFPAAAAVEELQQIISGCPVPCYYAPGNHDWHFEGLPGSECALRKEWTEKRMKTLFPDRNPLMYSFELNGVKFIMIDNSIHEILPEQYEFFQKEISDGKPSILFCHVPLYLPGLGYTVESWSCGHPDWCEATDPYWQIERREPWHKEGQSPETKLFWNEVMSAPNLLGIAAGHVHCFTADVFNNRFQMTVSSKVPATLKICTM